MIFIDLLSFKKKDESELVTDLEKWIYSIKNMGNMTTAPRMANSGVFFRLYNDAELAAMTTRDRNRYERSLKNYRDILADKETTRVRLKEAIKEGRAEGRAEERESLNIHYILRMRSKGYDDKTIADLLELSIDYVKKH